MNRSKIHSLVTISLILILVGCVKTPIGPTHDEVLIYDEPYDYTYLKTLEAINRTPGWNIYDTDKEAGLISAWNDTYEDMTDADKRIATFNIRRLGREKTSVELTEDCQTVVGVGDMMREIDIAMGKHKKTAGAMSKPFH